MSEPTHPQNPPSDPVSFTKAIMTYFGRKEGQDLTSFKNELAALTPADKNWLVEQFKLTLGWNVTL